MLENGAFGANNTTRSRRAKVVPRGSPWLYTYSHCHQMVTQQRPKGESLHYACNACALHCMLLLHKTPPLKGPRGNP